MDPDPKNNHLNKFEDLPYDPKSLNIFTKSLVTFRHFIYKNLIKNQYLTKFRVLVIIFILFNAYFIAALLYNRRNELKWQWCDGHGLLIILTAIIYWSLLYYLLIKSLLSKIFGQIPRNKILLKWQVKAGISLIMIGAILAFLIVDSWSKPKRLISIIGVFVMILIGLLLSKHPERIQWRQVLSGIGLQFILGLIVLRWDGGRIFLECISDKVTTFLAFSDEGSEFIYGYLTSGNITILESSSPLLVKWIEIGGLFPFQGLLVIFFFSFVTGILYHFGVMTWIVVKVGWIYQTILGTTAAESMNASASIFMGPTESPLIIQPYLNDLTQSEIHAVMTSGFSTIAGSVMAAYIALGADASSLLTATVMAAPASLSISKLLWPETQKSRTSAERIKSLNVKTEGNALDAASKGAAQGFHLVGNIIANLIAVVSFVAFLNAIIAWLGSLVGQDELSFEFILGKIFIPFAFCLGVDNEDMENVAMLMGLKITVNEMVAFQRLDSVSLSPRSRKIAEFAIASFANFGTVGIQLGGLGTLAPHRRLDFSQVAWSALIAGTLTTFINASIVGALIDI